MKPEQRERLAACIALAAQIVANRRAAAPPGFDPQNSVGIIAAVGTVAAAGASVYAANKSASSQKAALEAQGKQPAIVPAEFDDPSKSYDDYYNLAGENYPKLSALTNQFNAQDNAAYRAGLSQVSPSLLPGVAKQGRVADRFLHGKLTKDMQGEITRSGAYQSLMNGYGTDSGAAHALTARDIGVSSLDLIGKGNAMLGDNLQNARALTPFDYTATSLLFTPQQLQARSDSNEAYKNAVLNRNNTIQYQNSLYQTAANGINPTGNAITSGVGAINSPTVLNGLKSAYGAYQQSNSISPSEATQLATNNGAYNAYADLNNYDDSGAFIGNPYSSTYSGG